MKRWATWVAGAVFACMNLQASAQTTGTTTTPAVTVRTSGSSSEGIGAGGGIGVSATGNGSFSGGQGMTGGGGFSGGTSFTGGGAFLGGQQTGGGFGGRTGTTTTGPSQYNPFRATYVNPYAAGAGSTKTFGQPLYATVTTSPAGGAGGLARRGTTGLTGLGGAGAESTGFSTVGIRRAPAYATTLGPDLPIINVAPAALLRELRATLVNTDAIKSKNGIDVVLEGTTVVLRGRVENERERLLVEGMMRLTPGVRDIRNELVAP